MKTHRYSAYTNGCRCEVCRAAKADYMRERRAAARVLAQKHTSAPTGKRPRSTACAPGATRYLASVDRHGTRFAYEEWGCRCFDCTTARVASDARYRSKRDTRDAS